MVKNPPTMRETWVWSLGWEDTLEKGMATRSSILAWRIPWTEKSGGLQTMGSQRARHTEGTFTFNSWSNGAQWACTVPHGRRTEAVVRWIHNTSQEQSPVAREALWVLLQSLSPPRPECHGVLQAATDPSAWWWGGGCYPQGCPSSRLLRAGFCREPGGKAPQSRPGRRPSAPHWSGPASWTLSAEKITGENDQIRPPANSRLSHPWSHWVTAYRKNATLLIGLRRW